VALDLGLKRPKFLTLPILDLALKTLALSLLSRGLAGVTAFHSREVQHIKLMICRLWITDKHRRLRTFICIESYLGLVQFSGTWTSCPPHGQQTVQAYWNGLIRYIFILLVNFLLPSSP